MWKDVPVLFFPSEQAKQGEKTWQTGLKFCPPPPTPIAPPSWKNAEFGYTRYGHSVLHRKKLSTKILLTSFGGTEGGGWGGGGGGGSWG